MLTDITERQLISETDLEKLNDIGKKISLEFHLVREVQDITSKITGKTKGDQIIFEILASFAETFEKAGMDRIRSCSHEECILFFVDVSKGGKRRWCSMESCGNRAKVSNFYSRKKDN
ncbi:CGNR zinc finger domain-containing protein [Ammoniphilus sp. CFH 90114]|nr:CGNR zinc finger domain-containing protein [Ammoniphilus sp. CFH 90114]